MDDKGVIIIMPSKVDNKPKRTLNRVMIDPKKDDFYANQYKIIEAVSLTLFDPQVNSNKFYVAELHEIEGNYSGQPYRLFVNHGRVGANGQAKAEPFSALTDAKKKYNSKVREKVRKGYTQNDVAVQAVGSTQAQKNVNANAIKGVKVQQVQQNHTLHPKVVKLVEHLYAEANQAISLSLTGSVKSDVKSPIGNLGINGINAGRHILKQISQNILANAPSGVVEQLSIQYYKTIPRKMPSNLRTDTSWLLNNHFKLSKEFDILDLYEDALRVLPVISNSDILPRYQALNSEIRCVEDSKTLEYLNHKVTSTHASNHNYKLKLVSAYEVAQKNAPPFNPSCGNVVNLFHGSRSANLVGILSSYLKLPQHLSADIHKTGAMFGPGIYFAHNCTKSYNYSSGSWAGRKNKFDTAFLIIAEVAMGNVHKTPTPHPFTRPPQGYHSVMGTKGTHLQNDEFIVYDPSQVRIRYLLEVEKL